MANIKISNLKPAGFALLSDSESFMGSMRDVSEDELKITGGYYRYYKKYGSGSGSKSKRDRESVV